MTWRERAACLDGDPEIFDPARQDGESDTDRDERVAAALALCHSCPVRDQCLEANLDDHWLIVGGTTKAQRTALRRERGIRKEREVQPHGTAAGYARHYRRGEKACEPCRKANFLVQQVRAERRGGAA